MASMTKRERVMRTVNFEETDRVPLYDIIQNDPIIEHYAGEKATPENGERVVGFAAGRTLDWIPLKMRPPPPLHPHPQRHDREFGPLR